MTGVSTRRRRWTSVALLLCLVVTAWAGIVIYRQRQEPPFALLRQAYGKRRTLELRISGGAFGGGAFGEEHIERGAATRRPTELLDAELWIQRHLEASNSDPAWLHASGLAALLEGRFEDAVSALELARDLNRNGSGNEALLTDLASAYLGRATAFRRPIDIWMALETIGSALDIAPSSPEALYNRALISQKAFLYPNAAEGWKRFLAREPSGAWADEGRRQAALVERQIRLAEPSSKALDDLIELQADAAMRNGLPSRASSVTAEHMRLDHGDNWLSDALATRDPALVAKLAALVASRAGLQVDRYAPELRSIESANRHGGGDALYVWAEFERLFRVTHSETIAQCVSNAGELAELCRRRRYPWFLTQILLERSACQIARGNFDGAEAMAREAMQTARQSSFPVAELRAAGFLTSYLAASGHYREAAELNLGSLATFWSRPLPYARAQELFHDMVLANEGLGRWHTARDAASAAATMAMWSHVPVNEAVNRARWAGFAARLGLHQEAAEQYALSGKLFDGLESTPAVNQYRAFAEAFAALAGDRSALARFEPIARSSTNLFVRVSYLHTTALLAERSGQTAAARATLQQAIQALEKGAPAPHAAGDAPEWRDQLRSCYRDLTRIAIADGDAGDAYRIWQDFLRADQLPEFRPDTQTLAEGEPATVVTFARLGDRYGVWIRAGGPPRFAWVGATAAAVDRLTRAYSALTSLPSTSWAEASETGGRLYELLLGAAVRGAKPGALILVQPDAELARIPWASLADPAGQPVGESFEIVAAPTSLPAGGLLRLVQPPIGHALIVAATRIAPNLRDEYPPLPGMDEEIAAVRAAFPFAKVLTGADATAAGLTAGIESSDALHFAGHAMLSGPRMQLLVAPGSAAADPDARMGVWWPGDAGRRLVLAVLSACSTGRYRDPEDPRPESLARALLLNGTRQVVATLWNADSSAASFFMQSFYRNLRGNGAPAAAALAMKETRRQPAWSNPYYWASYSVFVRL